MKLHDTNKAGAGLLVLVLTAIGVGSYWPLDYWGWVLAGIIALAGVALIIKATRPEQDDTDPSEKRMRESNS